MQEKQNQKYKENKKIMKSLSNQAQIKNFIDKLAEEYGATTSIEKKLDLRKLICENTKTLEHLRLLEKISNTPVTVMATSVCDEEISFDSEKSVDGE